MKDIQVQIFLLGSNLEATKTGGVKPNKKTNVKNSALNGVRRRASTSEDTDSE